MKYIVLLLSWIYALIYLEAAVPKTYLFVGTYTGAKPGKGIYVYEFNPESGSLTRVSTVGNITNPSYLAISPDGRYVYACTETRLAAKGSVSAFAVDSSKGRLSFINKQQSGGENPVYLTADTGNKWLIGANYTGGSVSVYPLREDGGLKPYSQLLRFRDSSVIRERQESSHIHAAVFSPSQDHILFPDLGGDKIRIFSFDPAAAEPLQPASIPFVNTVPGSGPRHICFHPNGRYVYCIEELGGTVSVYNYDKGRMDSIQRIFSYSKRQDSYGSSDIHISPDGLFLYASNRWDEENTIAIFSIDQGSGRLTLVGHQATLGDHPRSFVIDPTGNFLIVANQETGTIVVFRRNPRNGLLRKVGRQIRVPLPSCLKMREYRR